MPGIQAGVAMETSCEIKFIAGVTSMGEPLDLPCDAKLAKFGITLQPNFVDWG